MKAAIGRLLDHAIHGLSELRTSTFCTHEAWVDVADVAELPAVTADGIGVVAVRQQLCAECLTPRTAATLLNGA